MSFRSATVAGIVSVAQTYATANPTLLKKVTTARPADFDATPHAYVVRGPETIRHDSGLRQRNLAYQLVVVKAFTDNEQSADTMDDLLDALLDAYTADPRAAGSNTLLEPVGVEDVEDQVGTVSYPGFAITLRATIQEGRL